MEKRFCSCLHICDNNNVYTTFMYKKCTLNEMDIDICRIHIWICMYTQWNMELLTWVVFFYGTWHPCNPSIESLEIHDWSPCNPSCWIYNCLGQRSISIVSSSNRLLVPWNTHTSLVHVLGLLQIVYMKSH